MADEREVVARLKTERTGETGAFKETAEEVKDLGEAASTAAPKVESFGGAAGGSSDKVAGMAAATAKAMAAVAAAGAILQTAAEGAKALGDAYGGLDEETDATVKSVGDLGRALSSLDVMGVASSLGQTLANVFNDLTDATKSNVVVNEELVAKGAEQRKHFQAVLEIQKDLVASELARVEKLELTAEALARQAAVEQRAGEISKSTAEAIKANVAAYGSIPAPLAAAAASLGILSAAEKKAADDARATAEQHKSAVQGIVAEITGIPAKVGPPLAELSKVVSEALKKIDFDQLNTEQLDRAKEVLQEFVNTFRAAGQQIPKYIADQAASLGVLVGAMEVAGGGATSFAASQKEAADGSVRSTQVFRSTGEALHGLEAAAASAGKKVKDAGEEVKSGGLLAGQAGPPVRTAQAAFDSALESFEALGKEAKVAGADVKSGAEKAAEGKAALSETGKAGSEAGAGLSAAKAGATGLGEAAGSAATGVGSLKNDLGGIGPAATPAATALESVKTAAESINALKFTAFIAELKAVENQAKATRAAVDSIDGTGSASAPTEPSAPGAGSDSGGGGAGGF